MKFVFFLSLLFGCIASLNLKATSKRKFIVKSEVDGGVTKAAFTAMTDTAPASPLATIDLLAKFNLNPGLKIKVNGYDVFASKTFMKQTDNHFILWMNQTIHVFNPQVTRLIHSFNCGINAPFITDYPVMPVISTGNKVYIFNQNVLREMDLVAKTTTTVGYKHFDGLNSVTHIVSPVLKFSSDKGYIFLGYSISYKNGAQYATESRIRKYDLREKKEVKSYIFIHGVLSDFVFYGNQVIATLDTTTDTYEFQYEFWTMNSNLDVASVRRLTSETDIFIGTGVYGNYFCNWYGTDTQKYRQFQITKQGNQINLKPFVDARIKLRSPAIGNAHIFNDMFLSSNGNFFSIYQASTSYDDLISEDELSNIYLFNHGNVGQLKSDVKDFYGNVFTKFNSKDSINLSLTNDGKYLWTLDGNSLKKWGV